MKNYGQPRMALRKRGTFGLLQKLLFFLYLADNCPCFRRDDNIIDYFHSCSVFSLLSFDYAQ